MKLKSNQTDQLLIGLLMVLLVQSKIKDHVKLHMLSQLLELLKVYQLFSTKVKLNFLFNKSLIAQQVIGETADAQVET
jgi:hypothetical protein